MNERVKLLRKKLGLTLEKFGGELGVTKVAISNIESGNRNLTEQMMKAICRTWNVNYFGSEMVQVKCLWKLLKQL